MYEWTWLGLGLTKEPSASQRKLTSGKVGVASVTASLRLGPAWPSYRQLDLAVLHWVLLGRSSTLTLPILVVHLLLIRVLESLAVAAVPAWGWGWEQSPPCWSQASLDPVRR